MYRVKIFQKKNVFLTFFVCFTNVFLSYMSIFLGFPSLKAQYLIAAVVDEAGSQLHRAKITTNFCMATKAVEGLGTI